LQAALPCAAIAALLSAGVVQAQAYPAKPVRIIVAYAPGGGTDVMARLFAPKFAEAFGQPFVVENRPGFGGNIGTELVAKSPPDGYTLLMTTAAHAINVSLYPKLPYDSARDLMPIATVASGPGILVTHPSLPARNLKELIALAKAKPGVLAYGSSGSGAPTSHLGMELLKVTAGINLIHVPYKSMAPALTDILGGQVHMGIPTINVAVQHIKSGRLRAIGVTSLQRSPAAPDVPPLAEVGMPGYEAVNWTLLLAPAGVPAAIAEKINADIGRVVMAPDLRDRFTSVGMDARVLPYAEVAPYVRSEIAKWGKVVKASGARPEG